MLLETVASFRDARVAGKSHRRADGVGGRFEGQVAVVTGGARGIGDAVVRRMVVEGARAVVPDLLEPGRAAIPGVRYVTCDITDADAVAEAPTRRSRRSRGGWTCSSTTPASSAWP